MTNILPIIFENTDYDTTITIQVKGSGAAVPLPGTIELTMYKHGITTPFVTATVGNGKLTSVGALTGIIVTNIDAADLADTGSQFGSIYVRRTDVPTVIVAFPVRFVEAGETLPADYDGTVLVQTSEITVEVRATVSPDVPPGSVTNTYLADMAAGTVKGNITGSTAGPADVTLADLQTAMGLDADYAPIVHSHVVGDMPTLNTDYAKGLAALLPFSGHENLLGEKFIVINSYRDGIVERDGTTMAQSTIANRSTVTRSGANARRRTRKRKGEAVAASTLRQHHTKEGSQLGVLYENAATNLLYYTSAMGSWTLVGGTITSGHSDPDGGTAAFKYVENAGNASHVMYANNPTIVGSNFHTASGFVKADGRNYLRFFLADGATQSFGQFGVIDFVAKTITSSNVSTGTDHASTIEEYPDGWFKFTLSGKLPGAISAFLFCYPDIDGTFNAYVGNGTSGVQFYGLQIEEGSASSSWVPTSGAASATRSADGHSVALTGYTADEMLLLAEFIVPPANLNYRYVMTLGGATSDDRVEFYFSTTSSTAVNLLITGATVLQFALSLTGLVAGQKFRVAGLVSKTDERLKMYGTGGLSSSTGLYGSLTEYTPPAITKIDPGNYYNQYQLDSTLGITAVIDGGALAADIIKWVEAV